MKKIFSQRKKILFVCMSILLMVVTILICKDNLHFTSLTLVKQEVRTVSYNSKELQNEAIYDSFDRHSVTENEDGFEIVAVKKYNISSLEELDLVGLDSSKEEVDVNYSIQYVDSESKILLTVCIGGMQEVPLTETIPGLVTTNEAGELDVLFAHGDEIYWLSDLVETEAINETAWWSWFKKVVKSAANVVKNLIVPALRLTVKVVVHIVGLGNAAKVLSMYKDNKNDYHADFDCWQSIAGYNKFYDFVFNLGSVMLADRSEFLDENGDGKEDYVLWGWKGDYWELGPGGELGIYRRWEDTELWYVDKKLAIEMTLQVQFDKYRNNNWKNIVNWNPKDYFRDEPDKQKQWWITGFDPDYVDMVTYNNQLKVSYTIKFVTKGYSDSFNKKLKDSFKKKWSDSQHKWSYSSNTETFSYSF